MTQKSFERIMTIVIGVATIVVGQITTIFVGVATIVVFCDKCGVGVVTIVVDYDNCEHCDNCDHITLSWVIILK